jgi:hypothetical protein
MQIVQATLMTGHILIQLLLLILPFQLMALQPLIVRAMRSSNATAVTDACGRAITPTVTTPSPVTCNGTMVYTFTYADCAGHTHDWTYTYTIAALILPFQLMAHQPLIVRVML